MNAQSAPAPAALELCAVSSGYGRTTILRDIDLTVHSGSVTALLGPNGAGKSTLLGTASGVIRPQRGQVLLDGIDVSKHTPNERCRMGLCHIPEGRAIFRSLTVRENLRLHAFRGEEDLAIDRAVDSFPILGSRLSQVAGTLSGGEQQMLAMARAYARAQRLVLVDEASLGLAPIVVDEIFGFLHDLTAGGASLLLVDQFVTRALSMANKAYVISRGQIVFAGTPDELQRDDVFQKYLGGK
jgi:branched-chain amino acid transport system ATP-binding protein